LQDLFLLRPNSPESNRVSDRFSRSSSKCEQLAVPSRDLRGTPRQLRRSPDQRQRPPALGAGLSPLGVLDGVSTRAIGVDEAQQAVQLDRLAGGVEDV